MIPLGPLFQRITPTASILTLQILQITVRFLTILLTTPGLPQNSVSILHKHKAVIISLYIHHNVEINIGIFFFSFCVLGTKLVIKYYLFI